MGYLTLFPELRQYYVQLIVRSCFCCIPPSWRMIFVVSAWSNRCRPWRWSKKPWNETSPSSQGLETGENRWKCVDLPSWWMTSPSKIEGWWGLTMRAFGLRWSTWRALIIQATYERLILFFKCCLICFKWTSNHCEAWFPFEVVHILQGCFCYLFFQNPTVSKGAKWGRIALHWCRDWRIQKVPWKCLALSVECRDPALFFFFLMNVLHWEHSHDPPCQGITCDQLLFFKVETREFGGIKPPTEQLTLVEFWDQKPGVWRPKFGDTSYHINRHDA